MLNKTLKVNTLSSDLYLIK